MHVFSSNFAGKLLFQSAADNAFRVFGEDDDEPDDKTKSGNRQTEEAVVEHI